MRKSVCLLFAVFIFTLSAAAQSFPSVTVAATDPVATEPGAMNFMDNGVFTVTREGPTNMALLVFFTLGGTASNGVDYAKIESPVSIPEGARSVRVPVEPLADDLVEGEERVILRLAPSPLAGPGSGYILPTNNPAAIVVIRDSNLSPPTNSPPSVHITQPSSGAIFKAPADIHIVAETVDPDGWVGMVEFFANNEKIGESIITFFVEPPDGTPITHQFDWKAVPVGQYSLTALATDDQGATRMSVPVRVSITDSNAPPSNVVPMVTWLRPTNGATFPAGSTILLSARATDSDGTVSFVQFYANSNRVGTASVGSSENVYNFPWSNAPAGSFRLHAEAVDNSGGRGVSDSVQIFVRDGGTNVPPRTVVSIVATDPQGSEIPEVPPGMGIPQRYDPAVFTVTRSGILNNPLTVSYAVSGTAANGVDYVRIPNDVTIPAGETSAKIEISVIDDKLLEGTESVVIAIQPPVCVDVFPPPPECYMVGAPGRAEARILDDDAPTNRPPRTVVSVVATDPEGSEIPEVPPGSERPQLYDPAIFTVSRTGPTTNALTVYYTVGGTALNGVDYDRLPGQVEIPVGASSANIEVSVIDDELVEGTESVTIRIDPPACIAIDPPPPDCYVVGVPPDGARVLTFDDLVLDEEHIAAPPGYGGLNWYNFHVINGFALPPSYGYHTGTVSPSNVVFNGAGDPASIRSRDGTFNLGSAYLTAALNIDDPLDIRVQGIAGDSIVYDNIYSVNRNGPTLAQFNYTGITEARFIPSPSMQFAMDNLSVAVGLPSRAEARILDNDFAPSNQPPTIAIISPREGAQFKAPANVPITATTFDHDGYTTRVEFYANNFKIGEATKEFLVPPPPGETIQFDFEWKDARAGLYSLTARGFDDHGAVGLSRPVRISIIGTNLPPPPTNLAIVSITAPDANASEHETNTATFLVRREGSTNFPLQVFYATQGTASNAIDYLRLPGSVIIPPGERSARIVVTPIDDQIAEPLESVVIALLPPPVMNSLPQYSVGVPARAAAVIADDDSPRPPLICLRDGVFHWCRPATNGQCFRIECSTDLITWTELCTAEVTEDAVHYVDAEAPLIRLRFYRAIPVACPRDGL